MTSPTTLLTWIFRVLIKAYQWLISPVLPGRCRFYPTCSSYALDAISTHGPIKGFWLGLRRVLRCHPWHEGGFDPVPQSRHKDERHKTGGTCRHSEYNGHNI